MTRALTIATFLVLLGPTQPAEAQQSPNFNIETRVLNAGGHPAAGAVLFSANYRITLDSLGDPLASVTLSSASFSLRQGFGLAFRRPGEVPGLLFLDHQTLDWNPEPAAGTYNLYRDVVGGLPALAYGACEQQGLAASGATDAGEPPEGESFFYLVTAENPLAEEGTKGFHSDGSEREGTVCP